MKKATYIFLMMTAGIAVQAQTSTTDPKFVSPNSYVYSSVQDGSTLYLGGSFTGVGYNCGNAAFYDQGSDIPKHDMPFINGTTNAIVPDNNGGWYVGGAFTVTINANIFQNLVHIKSNKTVDTVFQASTDNVVRALILDGTILYVGGSFTAIKSVTRHYLASVNKTNGNVQSFNPNLDNVVYSLSSKDTLLIAGGAFTMQGNNPRYYLAVFNKNTGLLLKNYPGANSYVYETFPYGNTVYAGGSFTYSGKKTGYAVKMQGTSANPNYDFPLVNGTVYVCLKDFSGGWYVGGAFSKVGIYNISNLAHIKSNNTVDTAFAPNPDNVVRALAIKNSSSTTLYVGGSFLNIGGSARNYCAAVNKNTGVPTTWDPHVNNGVYSLFVKDTLVYLGGTFTFVDGLYKPYSVCVSTANNADVKPYYGQTNSYVYRFFNDANLLYAGGSFTETGYSSRYAAKLSTTDDKPVYNFPTTNGTVYATVADGSGGYYLGGSFTQVNNQPISYLVHVLSNNTIDATFDPVLDGTVRTLAIDGANIYAGGDFQNINGTPRVRLGGINKTNGNTLSFRVDCSSSVLTLAVKNGILYAGGQFTVIDSITREYAAAVNLATATVTTWDADPNSYVYCMTTNASGSKIYLGGSFTQLKNATARLYLGSVNNTNGTPTSWDPSLGYICRAVLLNGANAYAGGDFITASGVTRNHLAAFDTTAGNETSWNPNLNGNVHTLAVSGINIYAGGEFTMVGATERKYIAAINSSTGVATSWDPRGDGLVYSLTVDGTNIVAGGSFSFLKAYTRQYASCQNLNNYGVTTNWDPQASYIVYAFAKSGNTVYLGGEFSSVKGVTRHYAAATDSANGNVLSWNPDLNSTVFGMCVQGSNVYTGGNFTLAGTTARNYVAAFNTSTGAVASWAPEANGAIRDMAYATNLFLCGSFDFLGGGSRSYIMAFDLSTDKLTGWAPAPSYIVRAIYRYNTKVYIGGDFTSVGGTQRYYLASLNSSTGALNTWNPGLSTYNSIYDLLVINDTTYAAGNMSDVTSNYLLSFKSAGTKITTWAPMMNGAVNCLATYNGQIAAGGAFTYAKWLNTPYICAIDVNTGLAKPAFAASLGYICRALLVKGSILYAGGDFTTANSTTRTYAASFNKTTGVLQSWNPTPNNVVFDLATDGTYIYAAGQFSMMNVSARNGLASMNATGTGAVQSWNPNANAGAAFRAIYISGAKVFVGGTCSMFGAAARTNFAVVDTDAVLQSFAPNPTSAVYDITGDATNLYVAGTFTMISSTARNYLVSYLLSNNTLRSWDPNIVGTNVQAVSLLTNKVYFGGNFTSVKTTARTSLASVDNSNSAVLQSWNPVLNSAVICVSASADDIFAGGTFSETGLSTKYNYFRGYDTGPAPLVETPAGENYSALRSDNTSATEINIYPNPFNDHFFIEMNGASGKTHIEIFNSSVQVVRRDEINEMNNIIRKEYNFENLPAGLYFVNFTNSDFSKVVKVIKE